jgi:hypothetical protein
MKRTGNVESFLSYKKLHRTGRLLRGLHVRSESGRVILINSVNYAQDHNEGASGSKRVTVKPPYVRGGAHAVAFGGRIVARPFMNPSRKIKNAPKTLVISQMNKLGWNKSE